MLNSLLEENINRVSGEIILSLVSSVILGLIISLIYIFTHKKEGYSGSFTITLLSLPAIASMILSIVVEDGAIIGAAFLIAGAIGFIRFRSTPGYSKDFTYIFIAIVVGFACGLGYVLYSAIFTLIVCVVMVVLYLINYPFGAEQNLQLKITIPENVDYDGLFDDLLEEYTDFFKFRRVRTVEFGAMFEVSYEINIRPNVKHKEFLDKIRCRNNNLSVSISVKETFDMFSI